jgi:hypothetical protein
MSVTGNYYRHALLHGRAITIDHYRHCRIKSVTGDYYRHALLHCQAITIDHYRHYRIMSVMAILSPRVTPRPSCYYRSLSTLSNNVSYGDYYRHALLHGRAVTIDHYRHYRMSVMAIIIATRYSTAELSLSITIDIIE